MHESANRYELNQTTSHKVLIFQYVCVCVRAHGVGGGGVQVTLSVTLHNILSPNNFLLE